MTLLCIVTDPNQKPTGSDEQTRRWCLLKEPGLRNVERFVG